ncbi:hypothetical protein ACVWW9_001846 [Agrococcus sp. UYP33]
MQRLENAVRYVLPVHDASAVVRLAVAEQDCCPFFSFDISLHGATFDLTIGTPPAGLEMLEELTGLEALSPRR